MKFNEGDLVKLSPEGRLAIGSSWPHFNKHFVVRKYYTSARLWIQVQGSNEGIPGIDKFTVQTDHLEPIGGPW